MLTDIRVGGSSMQVFLHRFRLYSTGTGQGCQKIFPTAEIRAKPVGQQFQGFSAWMPRERKDTICAAASIKRIAPNLAPAVGLEKHPAFLLYLVPARVRHWGGPPETDRVLRRKRRYNTVEREKDVDAQAEQAERLQRTQRPASFHGAGWGGDRQAR
ncbi:hypothetical protein LLH00_15565 [bacterium]|nr:hypothetical protein [bacterium]